MIQSFSRGAIWQSLKTCLVVTVWREVIQWVEGRDAAKILQCPGQHATLKNYPAANIKGLESAMVAKSWIGKGGI